ADGRANARNGTAWRPTRGIRVREKPPAATKSSLRPRRTPLRVTRNAAPFTKKENGLTTRVARPFIDAMSGTTQDVMTALRKAGSGLKGTFPKARLGPSGKPCF